MNNRYTPRGYYSNNPRTFFDNHSNMTFSNPQRKKRTGAKFHSMTKNGQPCITAWRVTKQFGLISYIVFPNKNTKSHMSKSGREWENWTVKVTLKSGKEFLKNALFDVQKKRAISNELNLLFSPSSPNGGYCGKPQKN